MVSPSVYANVNSGLMTKVTDMIFEARAAQFITAQDAIYADVLRELSTCCGLWTERGPR
jgi:hypothetical protein